MEALELKSIRKEILLFKVALQEEAQSLHQVYPYQDIKQLEGYVGHFGGSGNVMPLLIVDSKYVYGSGAEIHADEGT